MKRSEPSSEVTEDVPITRTANAEKEAGRALKMHLICNTHWDREYRWSFRETQMRLLAAMDGLLHMMETDPRFKSFHTDSQASMVDDYLDLRPKNRARVEALVKSGRLLIGPWYTLPAEFMVSGEALVRNLLLGHRMARDLGGVMKCGYNIFSWGQVSQLPQIYRQFGMDTVMFYRGVDQSKLDKLEFKWRAPDGHESLGITFGEHHRLNFWAFVYRPYRRSSDGKAFDWTGEGADCRSHLCDPYSKDINHHVVNQRNYADEQAALAGYNALLETVKDKASTRHLLFLQGFDMEPADPIVPDLVDMLNQNIDGGELVFSTLPGYVEELKKELAAKGLDRGLPVLEGEMLQVERVSGGFGPLYNGVFSARMPIKILNRECEQRLEKWAEPAAALAGLLGLPYPKAMLDAAWKEVLANQQHDGISGCHVDRITGTMTERYNAALDIAEAVTRDSLHYIVSRIDCSDLEDRELALIVFNPHPRPRRDLGEAVVDIPANWRGTVDPDSRARTPLFLDVLDADRKPVPVQQVSQERETVYTTLEYCCLDIFDADRVRLVFDPGTLPAMGYGRFTVRLRRTPLRPVETLVTAPNTLENEHLRARIHGDGRIDLFDKTSGHEYAGLHYFEDTGEQGGPLVHEPPFGNSVHTTIGRPADVALIYEGPLQATFRITHRWELPSELASDKKIHVPHGAQWIDHSPLYRSKDLAVLEIVTDVTLSKESRWLSCRTVVHNNVKDHRLRVIFPTGLEAETCTVDSPFDTVCRPIAVPDSTGWYEAAPRTFPTSSFVDISEATRGLAVLHRNLTEYEVTDNSDRAIAMTLLRCFSTAGNPSETYEPQPLAQCQGEHAFEYALYPHGAEANLPARTATFLAHLRVAQCTPHSGVLPLSGHSFVELGTDALVLSCFKPAENGDGYILRVYNPHDESIATTVAFGLKIESAEKVTLEECPVEALAVEDGNRLPLNVGKREIASYRLTTGTF